MANVTGDGDCAYSSVIASLKHARRTDPGRFNKKIVVRLGGERENCCIEHSEIGGRHRHCSCFGSVEMLEQEAKAKPFYNVVNNSGC